MVEQAQQGALEVLGVNGKLFLAQLVNFGVVALVMWKWVYTPLVKLLDERTAKISQGLKEAAEAAVLRADASKEKDALIHEARLQAKKLLDDAHAAAEAKREETVRRARQEVEAVVAKGKMQMRDEQEQMMSAVREQAATLVMSAVEKIVAVKLDPAKDEQLIRDSLAASTTPKL